MWLIKFGFWAHGAGAGFLGTFDRVSATFQRPSQHRVTWLAPRVSRMGGIDRITVPRDISD